MPLLNLLCWFPALFLPADPTGRGSLQPHFLKDVGPLILQAVDRNDLPGAVVLVLHRGQVVHREAYGWRAKEPAPVRMTTDTVFDLASLTKPVATATAIHLLAEEGKIRLSDPVVRYWPEFGQNGKEAITVEQLLTHTSGLIADNPLDDYRDGKARALERLCQLRPLAPPGSRFIYSDVGFIVLGELVERCSGLPLDRFAQERIFGPLGMTATGFRLPAALRERCAPTTREEGRWRVGEVHDPRAFQLGGVAGHAGLFSTADDLARYVQMLLNGGEYGGKRILKPETVRTFTEAVAVPDGFRSRGWDVRSRFSANRGQFFPADNGYGHTGFTGTSIWVDPGSQTALIFLSNRLHPDGKGNVTSLRGQVASLVARAVGYGPTEASAPAEGERQTRTGIDVLVGEQFQRLKGRRVGLVTNHTGVDRQGRATIDLLRAAPGMELVALYSPEHGIRGTLDEKVGDSKDEKTGLPVYSLYGERRKPTRDILQGVDTLVFDIQDAGCRFYTYISTLGLVLEAAAENQLKVVVLDRPNPIGGVAVAGPVLDAGKESFVAYHRLPVRHGMTVGELARLFNAERQLGANLEVVAMQGWQRDYLYDRTGLTWINPSPNLRSLTAALLYPGVGLLETTNLSVGRGTDRPFEWIGAPWLDGQRLADALAAHRLPGMRFVPVRRTPTASVYKGQLCGGVQLIISEWERVEPLRIGLTLAYELRRLFPNDWQPTRYNVLLGHQATYEGLLAGKTVPELEQLWQPELKAFEAIRRKYLIY